MKRICWAAIFLLLPVLPKCSFADGIPTLVTQADVLLFPTFGNGEDALAGVFFGTGFGATVYGDWNCATTGNWCMGAGITPPVLAPGSSLTPNAGFFGITNVIGTLTFGGQTQTIAGLSSEGQITALSGFTFPVNPRTFTVVVPAVMDLIVAQTENGDNFNLQIPRGRLILTFEFDQGFNGSPSTYSLVQARFTTIPEPGTITFIASGLAGIVGAALRRRHYKSELMIPRP